MEEIQIYQGLQKAGLFFSEMPAWKAPPLFRRCFNYIDAGPRCAEQRAVAGTGGPQQWPIGGPGLTQETVDAGDVGLGSFLLCFQAMRNNDRLKFVPCRD